MPNFLPGMARRQLDWSPGKVWLAGIHWGELGAGQACRTKSTRDDGPAADKAGHSGGAVDEEIEAPVDENLEALESDPLADENLGDAKPTLGCYTMGGKIVD
jgi:hypothetical protein